MNQQDQEALKEASLNFDPWVNDKGDINYSETMVGERHINVSDVSNAFNEGFKAACEHKDKEIKEEQQRTLRYKELLYSQTEQGKEIKQLREDLEWATYAIISHPFQGHLKEKMHGTDQKRERAIEIRIKHNLEVKK